MTHLRPNRLLQALAYLVATATSILFLYPYWWMLVSAFRPTRAIMSAPLRPWPETISFQIFTEIGRIGGVNLSTYIINSVVITTLSTVLGVVVTALGAYALTRRPKALGFSLVRYGFLVTIMYPYMLLVIPVYLVMFKLGLLGSYAGIVLFLALGPLQFFLFEQFFRKIPSEVIEAAVIDGANEWQILTRVVLPMACPSPPRWHSSPSCSTGRSGSHHGDSRSPDTYTLPVALLSI